MTARLAAALVLVSSGLLVGGAASGTPPLSQAAPASATGLAVEIVGPDQTQIAATQEVDSSANPAPVTAPFLYPADGSIVSTESTLVSTSAGTAAVVAEVTKLSLFGGEITADDVRGSVSSSGTTGDLADSTVSNLVVLGQPVTVAANTKVTLADWIAPLKSSWLAISWPCSS